MRPGGDPDGWRRAYFEASAAGPERGPVDSFGRFLLAFLPTFAAGHALASALIAHLF